MTLLRETGKTNENSTVLSRSSLEMSITPPHGSSNCTQQPEINEHYSVETTQCGQIKGTHIHGIQYIAAA